MEKIDRKNLESISRVELERLTLHVKKHVMVSRIASGLSEISDEHIARVVGCTVSALVDLSK